MMDLADLSAADAAADLARGTIKSIDLVEGERHVEGSLNVSGNAERDREALAEIVELLRAQRAHVEPDPHLLLATEVRNSEDVRPNGLPDSAEALDEIARAAEGLDLVGIWSSGPLYRAFANSAGQRNWYESANFNCAFEDPVPTSRLHKPYAFLRIR